MYICVYVCVCVCVCIHMHMSIRTYVYMPMHACVRACMHTYITLHYSTLHCITLHYIHTPMYYVSMHLYAHVHIYTHRCTCIYIYTYTHTRIVIEYDSAPCSNVSMPEAPETLQNLIEPLTGGCQNYGTFLGP